PLNPLSKGDKTSSSMYILACLGRSSTMNTQANHNPKPRPAGIRPLYLILLCFAVVGLFLVNIALGSVNIPIGEILSILFGGEASLEAWQKIVVNIRIPRAVTGILAGSALSVAGLQMQTLFRNPLAGPSVLGITAGASL